MSPRKTRQSDFLSVAIGSILVLLVAGCEKALQPNETKAVSRSGNPQRHISLDGQPNFRDLGGYQTSDGRTVKWGQVFRSGELPRLSDADVVALEELELRTVVSFLTQKEIEVRGPDRLPPGVVEVGLPMEAGNLGDLTAIVNDARNTGDFSEVPVDINPDIHRRLMDEGREYYAALMRELIDPNNRPLVFHCSHGVHRTGTASAILLSTLGVPWETVRQDYLLSNTYRATEINHRLGQLRDLYAENNNMAPEDVDTTNMDAFYILQGAYIDAALEEAVKEFGSMERYIRDGLGITDEEIEQLKAELLE